MKRIYSIFSVLLLLSAVSCVREEMTALKDPAMTEPTVPVILSLRDPVALQASTKATPGMEMGDEPAISSIHVAIFGTDRYLKDYVSAFPCDADGNPVSGFVSKNDSTAYFIARLPISSKERVLHIIGNGPSTLPFNAYENDIMQNLRVSDGNGAYWQRVVLEEGIRVVETDGVPEQTHDGEYIPHPETVTALSNIGLIRNFASMVVTSSAPNFQLISYTLCNMPSSGSVAMYSTNHGDWVPQYNDIHTLENHLVKYVDVDDNNAVKTYLGFPVNPELNTSIPSSVDAYNAPGVAVGSGVPVYVYERAVTGENPPFILMAARYVESGSPTESTPIQYYRLDLALESGYIPIYRNFEYSFDITGVSVAGYDNPGTAAQHNSGSNFSVSLDTRTLPDVSNDVVRLQVQQPNFDWVYNSDSKKFWYQFLLTSDSSVHNGDVEVTEMEGGNALYSFEKAGSDNANGQREVIYELKVPDGTSTLSSTLQLVGTYTDGSENTYRLVRMVTIRVFNAKTVNPTLTPSTVADQDGQLTTLGIPLPWDLQASMFPMEILIEDSAKALNPMSYETMPVKTTGIDDPDEVFKSLSDNTTPSYCFVRTLNWSDYLRLKNDAELSGSDTIVLTCDFETTKAFTSSTVYVYNKYFATDASGITTAQVTLTGDQNNNLTPNRQDISGTEATVTVKSSGAWTLDIKLANGNVAAGASLSPNSSSTSTTGQTVTVTLPENVTANAIRYQLTLTNTSANLTRTAYITQAGIKMSLTCATSSVGNGDAGDISLNVSVESGARYVLEVLDEGGNVLSTSSEYEATTGSAAVRQVTIPANPTLHSRNLTIRARNMLGTIWDDVTVTQAAGTASLTIVDNEIRMTTTSATVNVGSSFDADLKVYVPGNSVPVVTQAVGRAAARNVAITGIPANNTGADRTLRVDLCNKSGAVVATGNITQLGLAFLALTTSDSNIGNTTTSATLSVESEAAWTVSVSGGLSGASLSPDFGSATNGTGITLNVPVNNTLSAQTYTVTADNGPRSASVTVTQAAGVASLAQVDSEIMMQESTAQVSVTTSFDTTLKVFNDATDEELVSARQNIAATNSTASTKTVTVGTNSGSAITYRVQLYNSDDDPVGNSITFVQKPMIRITGPTAAVKGNLGTTVYVTSDVNWELTSPSADVTFGPYDGNPTTGAVAVTVNLPVNYTTSDVNFTVTAQGTVDTSLSASVAITHRKVTVNDGSVSFDTGNGSSGQFMSSTSATSGNVTATFSAIDQYADDGGLFGIGARDYTQLNRTGVTLTINTAAIPNRKALTGLTLTFNGNNYTTTSVTVQGTSASTTSTTATSWTGEDTATQTVFALSRNNNSLRVTGFTVNYQYYSWE